MTPNQLETYICSSFEFSNKASQYSVLSSYRFRTIPAIDILQKQVVRLSKGNFNEKQFYPDSPLAIAHKLEAAGHKFLHLVDLDGAKAKRVVNVDIIHQLCSETSLHIDFGGGLRTTEDVETVLDLGVAQITAGTVAHTKPDMVRSWLDKYGPDRIIIGADVRNGFISVSGWVETTQIHWTDFLQKWVDAGAKWVISTDVDKDGLLEGTALDLYSEMKKAFPSLGIIASGGVHTAQDIKDLLPLGVDGVIVGKAMHEGIISMEELASYTKSLTL